MLASAPMSVGFDVPSAPTCIHWWLRELGTPSTSVMPAVEAVRVSPTYAVPRIVGAPVAASFTGVTLMVMMYSVALSAVPSLTLNVKLA